MKNISKREKFLFWVIKNSQKWWLWVLVIIASSILVNSGPALAGLGVVIFGVLAFAAGIDFALGVKLGKNYIIQNTEKDKGKEK